MNRKATGWLIVGVAMGLLATAVARRRKATVVARRCSNRRIKVLVVGAGTIGSAYADRLARAGMDVTLLARGERLSELGDQGLLVQSILGGSLRPTPVTLVQQVDAETDYDLVIVAVDATQVLAALDQVRPLSASCPVLVLGNQAADPSALAERLGDRHVLLGFPAIAGCCSGGLVRILPWELGATLLGESDGSATQRLHQAVSILRRAGLKVTVERDMVSWLRTHAAMWAVLAGSVYRNQGSLKHLLARRQEMLRYLMGLREAYAALGANAIPVTPDAELRIFDRPLWLQVALVRTAGWIPWTAWAVDARLAGGADEAAALYAALLRRARIASLEVPALSSLGQYYGIKD